MSTRTLSTGATWALLFVVGVAIGLIGDAAHVQAGITEYFWPGVPRVWESALWFCLLVGTAIATASLIAYKLQLARRTHTRAEAVLAAGLILALYCLTTVIADSSLTAANGLMWGLAVAVWMWWDASLPAFVMGLIATVVGPLTEILMVQLGASQYTPAYDELFGVASWLMPLYFAIGTVLSGIFDALKNASNP